MKLAILLSVLLAFTGGMVSAAGPAASEPTLVRTGGGFEVHVTAPGPDTIADDVLQAAIDKVVAAGGGVVELGVGDFRLSRRQGEETVVLKSNVTLRGQGHATHVYLDRATPPNPERY